MPSHSGQLFTSMKRMQWWSELPLSVAGCISLRVAEDAAGEQQIARSNDVDERHIGILIDDFLCVFKLDDAGVGRSLQCRGGHHLLSVIVVVVTGIVVIVHVVIIFVDLALEPQCCLFIKIPVTDLQFSDESRNNKKRLATSRRDETGAQRFLPAVEVLRRCSRRRRKRRRLRGRPDNKTRHRSSGSGRHWSVDRISSTALQFKEQFKEKFKKPTQIKPIKSPSDLKLFDLGILWESRIPQERYHQKFEWIPLVGPLMTLMLMSAGSVSWSWTSKLPLVSVV